MSKSNNIEKTLPNYDLLLNKPSNSNSIEINFPQKKIARFLGFVVLGLIIASVVGTLAQNLLNEDIAKEIIRLFYIDSEANIPSTYSSWSLLLCSVILAAIAIVEHKGKYGSRWKSLSFIFLFLAVDEAVMFHESTIPKIGRWLLPSFKASGFLSFAWVIVGALFVLSLILFYWKFIFSLPSKTKFLFILSAIIYLGGAIGVECVGGWYADMYGYQNHVYSSIATFEEALEMIGVLVFIYGLLQHINLYLPSIKIQIENRRS